MNAVFTMLSCEGVAEHYLVNLYREDNCGAINDEISEDDAMSKFNENRRIAMIAILNGKHYFFTSDRWR